MTTIQDIQASISKIEEASDIIREEWSRIEYLLSLEKPKKLEVKLPQASELSREQWEQYGEVLGVQFID